MLCMWDAKMNRTKFLPSSSSWINITTLKKSKYGRNIKLGRKTRSPKEQMNIFIQALKKKKKPNPANQPSIKVVLEYLQEVHPKNNC